MLTKRKINFNLLSKLDQSYSRYEKVIYFLNNTSKIIIEDPRLKKTSMINRFELQNYINIKKVKTPWLKDINNNYYRVNQDKLDYCLKLNNEVKFVNLQFLINNRSICKIIHEQYNNISINVCKHGKILVNCRVPMFPIWVRLMDNRIIKICIEFENEFYKFPYGNVFGSTNSMCLGNGTKNQFTSTEDLFINLITTIFNDDYNFQIYFDNKQKFIKNFNQITKTIKKGRSINFLNMLYYLSQFNENNIHELSKDNIFVKISKTLWDEELI